MNNSALTQVILEKLSELNNNSLYLEYATLLSSTDDILVQFLSKLLTTRNPSIIQNPSVINQETLENLKNQLKTNYSFFEVNPAIFDLLDENRPETLRTMFSNLIVGHVQSGKTSVMCGIVTYSVIGHKRSVVVITRNLLGDYRQLARNFTTNGRFSSFRVSTLFIGTSGELALASAIQGDDPSLIICLENHTEMGKLNMVINHLKAHNNQVNFDLVIDESDAIMFKKGTPKVLAEFQTLTAHSRQYYGVTATSFENLKLDDELKNSNILCLPIPDGYKGVEDFKYHRLPRNFNHKIKRINSNPLTYSFTNDLMEFYYNLQDQDIFTLDNDIHPIICLHKAQTTTDAHLQFVSVFARDIRLKEGWVAIAFNGAGISIWHPSLNDDFQILGVQGKESRKSFAQGLGILEFPKVSIGDALQALRDLDPACERFHHIAIIAKNLADRGVNFVSNRDYVWHLTHELYLPSATATTVDMVQSARLCGIYNDNIPLTLCIKEADELNLRRTWRLHSELIQKCTNYEEVRLTNELVEEVPVNANNVPIRKITKKTILRLNQVLPAEKLDEEWGIPHMIRNIQNNLRSGRETVVIKILKFLIGSCPNMQASKEELIDTLGLTFSNYDRWNREHTYYKLLVPVNNNLYEINPCVLEKIRPFIRSFQ